MSSNFPPPAPVPCNDQHETPPLTEECALGDVVESGVAVDPRLHAHHVVGFDHDAPSVRFDADHVERQHRHDIDHDDDHAGALTNHEDDVGHREERSEPRDRLDTEYHDDHPLEDDRDTKRQLLERDRLERRASRERARRERHERRTLRSAQPGLQRRQPTSRRPWDLGRRHERRSDSDAALRGRGASGHVSVRDRRPRAVSAIDHRAEHEELSEVAADANQLNRPLGTRVHGTALVLYFILLPYVVFTKWRQTSGDTHASLVHGLLVVLAVFWLGFLLQVVRNVAQLRRGGRVKAGGSAWLAGLVVALLSLLAPTSHVTLKEAAPITIPHRDVHERPLAPHHSTSLEGIGALPLALMAKRRGDLLREEPDESKEFDVDESIELLRSRNPELIAHLAGLIGDALEGVIDVKEGSLSSSALAAPAPLVACVLGPSATGTLIGFAHEGGRLPVAPSWSSEDIVRNVVALHEGRVVFVKSEAELLRALATRTLRHNVVVFLGAANQLDDELAACAVAVTPYLSETASTPVLRRAEPQASDLRVELLRADPNVVGLSEPFTPTLRRRCVEMVAYLALHRHEPVTGERLRTRVLAHADVDASQRTLANTASAVRRSLGTDAEGPRLHPVTSSGLYVTHGISSDVETFFSLVARARQLPVSDASPLAHQALLLIKGEPLASALRGFEWFLAEGHGARLARDGEWAALALHHTALERGNYELAFWAIQQGRLIDPYSDALSEALTRVPRLREFGGDGAGRAQHGAVGPRGAVAMSWAFSRFTQQVSQ